MTTHAGHHAATGADPGAWLLPLVVVLVTAGIYLVGTRRWQRRRGRAWDPWRTASWIAGAVAIALALSPLTDSPTARAHMVQHLLLGMLAPVGLVLGAPVTLLLGVLRPDAARVVTAVLRTPAFHLLSHPVTAAVLNVGGMFVLYLTPLYALSTESTAVHHLVHAHFLIAGYLFAWAIAGPDPAPRRPGMATRVVVLITAGAAHAYLAKLLYARAGELPPGTDYAVADMQAAAQWMYYGGDVVDVMLAVALFATWLRRRSRSRENLGVGSAVVGTPRT
ncbi:cytochrome c oxidase assembly protein [Aeromicrobium duanguangcaii]|uniref:Cytochrome c oxidase assembly protein n=1 Tax=Aeromicrobium duanguangcaii TaxID=2968086 RepID=A0ABY5KD36_9ACTN|nr:cytochrome c oxidase assembly protein [Aeromicrobium duanguangcaii]MCD9154800.1 cytochrome c oxidase assembly protein [Aeromicrobium duanguangcaii]UUI67785.1 cytochrome c oxidase assembly protein [Aeromicrobium duanguangcaii]